MNRNYILDNYQWLKDDNYKNVIMGDDLDAALSTILYLKHNPNAKLVGIYYNYKYLIYNLELNVEDLSNCIFLDLDIYQEKCRSLGHHIIRIDSTNILKGFANSCNLNEI